MTTIQLPVVETSAKVSWIASTSATIQGNLSIVGSAKKVTAGFEYGQDTNYGINTPVKILQSTGNYSYILQGLEPGITYHFRALKSTVQPGKRPERMLPLQPFRLSNQPLRHLQTFLSQLLIPPAAAPLTQTDNITVNPDNDTQIISHSNKIKLTIPRRDRSRPLLRVFLTESTPLGMNRTTKLSQFKLEAFDVKTDAKVSQFNKGLPITIQHTTDELRGLDTDSLHLYYLDESSHQWVLVRIISL